MKNIKFNNGLRFLKSALTTEGIFMTIPEVIDWVSDQNRKVNVNIKRVSFKEMKLWELNSESLKHSSGNFFSIEGIRVKTNRGVNVEWQQPIINQPEVGYLGFITKEFKGILYFLMQAKIEPGNVNYVQLSPTLQATKSNYTRAHKGNAPAFLSYFQNAQKKDVLLDQLQSEQGGRFLKKRNRNIIIKTEDSIEVPDNYIWLTLGQIKELIKVDNLINMDTRTVISGIPFGDYSQDDIDMLTLFNNPDENKSIQKKFMDSYLFQSGSLHSFNDILSFITGLKCRYDLSVASVPLSTLKEWNISEMSIAHLENKYFKVIAAEVEISNREVIKWYQPMVEPAQEGICAFVCKEIGGVLHFIIQAKLECGNFDVIELAPTVQCLTGNYKNEQSKESLPFLDYVLNIDPANIIYNAYQSEEGGRFYQEQNRNMIVLATQDLSSELPEHYIWVTLNQLQRFIQFNNYINIQARSLMAAISFI